MTQLLAVAVTLVFSFVASLVILKIVDVLIGVRVEAGRRTWG
jgi:ammonia channel protein AmtB